MASKSPKFIVFEGIDGSGTTTQAKLLWEAMSDAHLTQEPTTGRMGRLARQIIREAPEDEPLPSSLAYLFAGDRHEHVVKHGGILSLMRDQKTIICDRYIMSSFAYQYGQNDLVQYLNNHFPVPDLTFYLDVSIDVAMERILRRGEQRDFFETKDCLSKIRNNYQQVLDDAYEILGNVIVIDGDCSAYDIQAYVLEEVNKLWGSNQ